MADEYKGVVPDKSLRGFDHPGRRGPRPGGERGEPAGSAGKDLPRQDDAVRQPLGSQGRAI